MIERKKRFSEILTEAVNDFADHGYDNADRLEYWLDLLREAATAEMLSFRETERRIERALSKIYERHFDRIRLAKYHRGINQSAITGLSGAARRFLDQRIYASAELIRLNRQTAIETVLKRASGYLTSIPPGGGNVRDERKARSHIAKPLAQQTFEERRVTIDQGHKLISNIDQTIAEENAAIAMKWRHVHQRGYNGRPEHIERDGEIFVLRGNWALSGGLMKRAGHKYLDEIDAPGEAVFCRCWGEYIYHLRDLPDGMVTKKGERTFFKIAA